MANTSNQGLRQDTVRALTGTALSYEGDWHALFDQAGIPAGGYDGRLLAWINQQLGTTYGELNGAMCAFAIAKASPPATSWGGMGQFTLGAVINLSNAGFTAGNGQGTPIGTLSVVGGTGTYIFTLTDSHSNATQVSGSSLQVGSSSSSAGSFSITVHADNGAGSTANQVFLITATPPVVTYVPTYALLGF